MRALAALIILGAHYSWVSGLSSGLTLFLAISGYVSGAKIKRALDGGVKLGLFNDLRNTLWRLLLPMHLVLLAVAIWIFVDVDVLKKADWLKSVFAMSLGFGNYYEIANSSDYWVRTSILSPTLHLWAMSMLIQGAISLAVIRFVVTRVAPKMTATIRSFAFWSLGAIAVLLGFLDALRFDGTTVYHFNSLNWAWAFLLGLFLGGLNWRWSSGKSVSIIVNSVFFGILIVAVLPVFGVEPLGVWIRLVMGLLCAIILLAPENGKTALQNFLNSRVLQFLGGISFGIYLIHWPLLIAFRYYTDENRGRAIPASVLQRSGDSANEIAIYYLVALTAASILLAWMLNELSKIIVKSIDSISESKKFVTQVIAIAIVPLMAFALSGSNLQSAQAADKTLTPSLENVGRDYPTYLNEYCESGVVRVCYFGEKVAEKKIVIVGTSTAGQWFDAIAPVVKENGWQLQVMIKEGCTHAEGRQATFCDEWRQELVNILSRINPDLVVMETTHANKAATKEAFSKADQFLLKSFADSGIPVMGIRTTPRFGFIVPECIQANSSYQEFCSLNASDFYLSEAEYQDQLDSPQFVEVVDLTNEICPNGTCTPVDGKIIRYIDDKHFTATYAKSLADELEPYLLQALGLK